ncbi:YCF48-related protein [Olivibacter sp. XZL3]|uniref:WD40/YVTN/BNR-like repeat-containing protein n=1 Tax=Olivibacter sp. XZL3 TaxID=1735116 RepID=UPI0014170804|nr:YCF48-related protein [Olivibacter sp. XZL3]
MLLSLVILFTVGTLKGQQFKLEMLQEGKDVSFRGMSIPSDSVAWISGTKGTIVKTTDGGENWTWLKTEGYEDFDFRSIVAFSDKKAIIVNAGSPAVILLTEDGGTSWKKVYSYDAKEIFYDGISFWDDKKGIVFGDPIEGKLQLLVTEDGGNTWMNISDDANVQMKDGEAGFAASGSSIRTAGNGLVWIGTGGTQARLLFSYNYGQSWTSYRVPIEQGEESQGIFSLAINDQKQLIAIGGDYKNFRNNNNIIQLSTNGMNWNAPKTRLSGYKSCVDFVDDTFVLATGTSGTDFSVDGGQSWKLLDEKSFHVVRASESGKLVLLAGDKGNIYRMVKDIK